MGKKGFLSLGWRRFLSNVMLLHSRYEHVARKKFGNFGLLVMMRVAISYFCKGASSLLDQLPFAPIVKNKTMYLQLRFGEYDSHYLLLSDASSLNQLCRSSKHPRSLPTPLTEVYQTQPCTCQSCSCQQISTSAAPGSDLLVLEKLSLGLKFYAKGLSLIMGVRMSW